MYAVMGTMIETIYEQNKEYIGITSYKMGLKTIHEKLEASSMGLYCVMIKAVETYSTISWGLVNPDQFGLWHDRLVHLGASMMRRIIQNTKGHPLKDTKVLLSKDYNCEACSQEKLIIKPSITKVDLESPLFLQRIQGDICGPIQPPSEPFRYFMVLVDALCRWSYVCLLSTHNVTFARLLAQIIKLRAQFPDYPIKGIRMDNGGEFTSKSFDTYCASLGIEVEHPVAYVHTQNGLTEYLIKHIQIIARTLLLRTNLNDTAWGHAVLHAAALIRLRPTASLLQSLLQMVLGYEPDISHLRTFGCAVQVPIARPKRTKMGPQRRLGIYVGFNSPSIIRFLEPTTGDLFTARFADCRFNETMFPLIGTPKIEMAAKQKLVKVFSWNEKNLSQFDPRTPECENEVQRIIHLQAIANRLPDAFNDATKVMKSHIPTVNAPARIVVPEGQAKMDENRPQLKRGRPIGSKDTVPQKRRGKNQESTPEEPGAVLTSKELNALEEAQTHEKTPTLGILRIPLHIVMKFGIEIKSSLMIFLHSQLLIKLWMMIVSRNLLLNAVKCKIGLSGRKQLRLN